MNLVPFPAMGRRRSKVQRLYDACTMVFSKNPGFPTTLREIRWLQGILDTVEAHDVGIDGGAGEDQEWLGCCRPRETAMIAGSRVTEITYIHIHECDDFSIGVFCLPAGATLPLHDHPEMVVLSKLLYGSVSCRSYDWVRPPPADPGKCEQIGRNPTGSSAVPSSRRSAASPRTHHRLLGRTATPKSRRRRRRPRMRSAGGLARLVMDDRVLEAPCRASVLFPRSGGNLHSFTAVTPCAILDVLAPPYSEELGRPSTYFVDVPIPSLQGFAMLEEREVPDDLVVIGAPYLGPELAVVAAAASPCCS